MANKRKDTDYIEIGEVNYYFNDYRVPGLQNKLDETNSKVDNNTDAIATETERAKAAEKENADAIATETERAKAAEKQNADAIADETKRAKAAEKQNADAIATETERAKAAEKQNADAIADETKRAKAAEKQNADAIADETKRAKAAEKETADAIASISVMPEDHPGVYDLLGFRIDLGYLIVQPKTYIRKTVYAVPSTVTPKDEDEVQLPKPIKKFIASQAAIIDAFGLIGSGTLLSNTTAEHPNALFEVEYYLYNPSDTQITEEVTLFAIIDKEQYMKQYGGN